MSNYLSALEKSMTETNFVDDMPAKIIHLTNANGMTVTLMDIGATWLSCTLPLDESPREVLLRSPNMAEHLKQQAYLGATVGRFANRIAKGKFTIAGESYQLDINNGENALHGGLQGFSQRRWDIEENTAQKVSFSLFSANGDQGYPGDLRLLVSFTLGNDNSLTIDYHATTNKATPLNLTNHAYFNLAGIEANISGLEQYLEVKAKHYLPINDQLIPTGELESVENTGFDFRKIKTLKKDFLVDEQQKIANGYDHYFVFDKANSKDMVATLHSPQKDCSMRVKTTKPGMQLYTGNFLSGNASLGKIMDNHDGIALETQYFPDAPNQAALCQWVDCAFLAPENTYQHKTVYQFEF